MNAESDQSGLSFQLEGEALSALFNGRQIPSEKMESLFALLERDMKRRVKQLESYVPLMCKRETND